MNATSKDGLRFQWLLDHYESIGFAPGDREPDNWVKTSKLRETIDRAMEREIGVAE